jgi:hypothetical protein
LTEHPIPRGVSFTGSIATGKKVNVAAAADLKRVLLELGGNDAAIVLPDADPADVAEKLFWPAFRNSGQICMAVKRVFVPEELQPRVVEALAAKARSVKVGNGLEQGTELGPVNNEPQFERVKGLVAEAIEQGAVAAAGGHPHAAHPRRPLHRYEAQRARLRDGPVQHLCLHRPADRLPDPVPGHQEGLGRGPGSLVATRPPVATSKRLAQLSPLGLRGPFRFSRGTPCALLMEMITITVFIFS